jgi:cell division protein ZapA
VSERKTSVKVTILGEEHTIRSDAPAEHTRQVARYLDDTVRTIQNSGTVADSHRAAILAALQITDELFRERAGRAEVAERIASLSAEVRRMLPPVKRGTPAHGTNVGSAG